MRYFPSDRKKEKIWGKPTGANVRELGSYLSDERNQRKLKPTMRRKKKQKRKKTLSKNTFKQSVKTKTLD